MRLTPARKTALVILILLMALPLIQPAFAQNISQDLHVTRAVDWVKSSKMIVEKPLDPSYNGTLPPMGGVYFFYDSANAQFSNRLHVPSAAEYVKLCADLYRTDNDPIILARMKVVADFLLASTTKINFDGSSLTVVAPIWQYTQGKGWNPVTEEYYTRDTLNVAEALLQAYQITKNEGYSSKATELLNTAVRLQAIMENQISQSELPDWTAGAFPWILYNYEGDSDYSITTKDLDLTLTDVAWGAFTLGYNLKENIQYLQCRDKYFSFMLAVYQRDNFAIRYPYQFISNRASATLYFANYDSVNREWGPLDPFTSDSAFYQTIGFLENENATMRALGEKFLNDLSLLQQGGLFEDSYYIDGTPVGYGEAIIATGLHLTARKLTQNVSDQAVDVATISSLQLYDSTAAGTSIYNGAWDWSPNATLVESMATVIVIHSLILNSEMIPKTNEQQNNQQILIIVVFAAAIVGVAGLIFYLVKRKKRVEPSLSA